MNRRSFFASLVAAAGATIVAPQILLSSAHDRMRWKKSEGSFVYVPNPEWYDAPYELHFFHNPESGTIDRVIEATDQDPIVLAETSLVAEVFPMRFYQDELGRFRHIPAYIKRKYLTTARPVA